MRQLLIATLMAITCMACKEDKTSSQDLLSSSTGSMNTISVVVDNESWGGSIGEGIRNVLAASIYGLPQDEPIFNINQIPPHVFDGFITKNRTVLKIVKGTKNITFKEDVYAKPQRVIQISGQTKKEILDVLNENSDKIISTFKNVELKAKQLLIKKSLYNTRIIEDNLGLKINFPTAYRIAKTIATNADKFYWIKRDIPTGYVNLLLYELPLHKINKDSSVIEQIVKIRDSIGEKYIEGPVEGSYLITENAYTPFHTKTIVDNKPTLETKGLWEVKNAFMGGPYVNYAIEDKINKRWIVVEGFAYAPSVSKRNYMFELEAIIKSIKIH